MNPLISAQGISKSHGAQTLFENLFLTLSAGDKIGLIGPNGMGKTSLLKILAGIDQPDSGSISKRQHLRIGYASQSPEFPSESIEQFLVDQPSHGTLHERHVRARILLGKAEFPDSHADASKLSGGWKKRLDLVRALMDEPEYLFLDEPTNHLDLEGILWLEQFLKRIDTPFLLISHDRYFLENCANQILELNKCYPQGMFLCKGNMSMFMQKKEEYLLALEKQQRSLAYKVREENNGLKPPQKHARQNRNHAFNKPTVSLKSSQTLNIAQNSRRLGLNLQLQNEKHASFSSRKISQNLLGINFYSNISISLLLQVPVWESLGKMEQEKQPC